MVEVETPKAANAPSPANLTHDEGWIRHTVRGWIVHTMCGWKVHAMRGCTVHTMPHTCNVKWKAIGVRVHSTQ